MSSVPIERPSQGEDLRLAAVLGVLGAISVVLLFPYLLELLARIAGGPRPAVVWVAIVFAALLFGGGHLPAAAQVWSLEAVVVTRTLLLNGVGGLVFGWLYWRQGFESAVLAHFSADQVLHVAAPLVVAALA